MSQDVQAKARPEIAEKVANGNLPYSLHVDLTVTDRETIERLWEHPEGELRDEFALAALKIGVLALKHAGTQVDADKVRREADQLLKSLGAALAQHAADVRNDVASSLKEYFDPHSGRFQERVERLVKKDGELEQLLTRKIVGDDSDLAKTLACHVGETSPLLKLLHPDESKGLLAGLRQAVEKELTEQRTQILSQFSLDNENGALKRLVTELQNNHGELNKGLKEKVDDVRKEFSLDDENSALSRLVRNVDRAQKTITSEFSLDNNESALARLRRELLEVAGEQAKKNQAFQEEVKVALATIAARRDEAQRSTQHGLEFEDAVYEFLAREAQHSGDIATPTGTMTGLIKNCKVGDCTVELGPDSAAPGALVAVEAKEKAGYTLAQARKEIETARKNRNAQMGLFVFSSTTAPPEFGPFVHLGKDVFVVWNAEDAATDIFLKAGIITTRALCIRAARQGADQAADFTSIDKAVLEIEKRCDQLGDIETWTNTISNSAKKISDKIRTTRDSLARQVETLREKVDHLRDTSESNKEN